jgi:hypothetical protein
MNLNPMDCYNMFIHGSFCRDEPADKWSLISLGSLETVVDIKVLYTCSRLYAFSIDSFEIELDPLLYGNYSKKNPKIRTPRNTVIPVYSNYPNIEDALSHLSHRIIRTEDFGKIHHGLYRYSLELARGNKMENHQSELILIQKFWEEFEEMGLSGFKMSLSKFVAKHRKHWFEILSNLYDVISRYTAMNGSSADVLEVILKFMRI